MSSILSGLFSDGDSDTADAPESGPGAPEADAYPRDVETVVEELDAVETAMQRLEERREELQRECDAAERAKIPISARIS